MFKRAPGENPSFKNKNFPVNSLFFIQTTKNIRVAGKPKPNRQNWLTETNEQNPPETTLTQRLRAELPSPNRGNRWIISGEINKP